MSNERKYSATFDAISLEKSPHLNVVFCLFQQTGIFPSISASHRHLMIADGFKPIRAGTIEKWKLTLQLQLADDVQM